MARSPRKAIYEQIRRLAHLDTRTIDVAARLRVWKRNPDDPDGAPVPGELLPRVYGGKYDLFRRRYVGTPDRIEEIACHPGQVDFLTRDDPEVYRLLAKGSPGGGKSMVAVVRGLLADLDAPNGVSGAVAPTRERTKILWRKTLDVAGPRGWIHGEPSAGALEVTLMNQHLIQFRAAKRAGASIGSPIQGYDWMHAIEDEQQNIDDETLMEVDLRGRVAGKRFRVWSTATNAMIPAFQRRLQEWSASKNRRVISFRGIDNVFTPLSHWLSLRDRMSSEDYSRLIEGEDFEWKGAIYPRFHPRHSLRQRPLVGARDITGQVVAQAGFSGLRLPPGGSKRYIVGQDWGSRVMSSHVLQCYYQPGTGDRLWWVVGEIVTEDSAGSDVHARKIVRWLEDHGASAADAIVLGDPHLQTSKADAADRSDYTSFRRAGLDTFKASSRQIPKRHRFAMVNALLQDANGNRRLFVDVDDSGRSVAPRAVESFRAYCYGPNGEPQQFNKDGRDLSHFTDDIGYSLWPWERFRGDVEDPANGVRSIPVPPLTANPYSV